MFTSPATRRVKYNILLRFFDDLLPQVIIVLNGILCSTFGAFCVTQDPKKLGIRLPVLRPPGGGGGRGATPIKSG